MRVIWPHFMVWTRHAHHAIAVQLGAMRCKRVGHRKLIGVWDDKQNKHIAYCASCETMLPDVEVPSVFKEAVSV